MDYITVDLIGTTCRIGTSHPKVLNVVERWFDCIRLQDDVDAAHSIDVEADGDRLRLVVNGDAGDAGEFDEILTSLLRVANQIAIRALDRPVLHAGAVATPTGDVLIFPGESGAGKSTLVAACLQVGFNYVTDEAVLIDPDSLDVRVYAKPLWLARFSRDALGLRDEDLAFVRSGYKAGVSPNDLGATVAQPPLRVAHVIRPRPRRNSAELEPLEPSSVAAELAASVWRPALWDEGAFAATARLTRQATGWTLWLDDPRVAAQLLADTFLEVEDVGTPYPMSWPPMAQWPFGTSS